MSHGNRGRAAGVLLAAIVTVVPAAMRAEEATRLDPIVVTATRVERKVSEQASAVSVVTREEIEGKSPLVAGDVLQGIPGVDVQRSGSAGNRENIKIRGGLGTHTLVLIDGFPVNSPTLGQFDLSSLPVDGFDRVEVVRGTQSALYGSNAMGGVVNFLPRKGKEEREYGVGVSGGSYSTLAWKGFAQGGGKKGNLHLGASGFESDGILENDDTSLASFLGAGEWSTGGWGNLHAIVLSTGERKGIPVDFGSPRDENHDLVRRGLLVGARWEVFASEAVVVTASGSIFDEDFHEEDPADPDETFPFAFDDKTETRKSTFGLQGRVSAGRRSTTFVGVEYQKDRGKDVLLSNFGDTRIASSTYNRSAYLQEEIRLWEGSGVSLGARLDENSEAGTEFNPKIAIYQKIPGTRARIRGAAGRGFRVPTLSEKYDPFIGNAGLSPEVAVSWETGADATLLDGKGRISATWFYQDFRDLIQFDGSVPGPAGFGQLRNVGKAFSRGVEAEAEVRLLPSTTLLVVYTFTDTWDAENRRRILGVPEHRGTLSVLLHPSPRWEGRVDWRVESDQLDAPPNGENIHRAGYARVDAFARYRWEVSESGFREIILVGRVQNLLDREYEERKGFPSPRFNFLLGAEVRI
ncbi:MAG TPA: TonB-dependent receptor [Candidatus Deferrimicrobiaceae bacterium]|nr:TonB-dependent receptor [Candidatus Deferrimicrobiaceae bacterium]